MEIRSIGGVAVSSVGLGCNTFGSQLDFDQSARVVAAGLDAGVTFFDTADIYGGGKSEEFLGRALTGHRNNVTIATKFGYHEGASPGCALRAAEQSLRRLKTDYIDLFQLHRFDGNVSLVDTLEALQRLVCDGKVRAIGCSNFSAQELREAAALSSDGVKFVCIQNQFSLLYCGPEGDILPACKEFGIMFLPYFPLAHGLLTGKHKRGAPLLAGTRMCWPWANAVLTDKNFSIVEALEAFATRSGYSLLELAIAWLLAHAEVASVIAGATSAEQVQENARTRTWHLTDAEREVISRIVSND